MAISRIVYEIASLGTGKEGFIYRGWDVRGDHMPKTNSESIVFGDTEIELQLVDGLPTLTVPINQRAEIEYSDHASKDGKHVKGKFVQVSIF